MLFINTYFNSRNIDLLARSMLLAKTALVSGVFINMAVYIIAM